MAVDRQKILITGANGFLGSKLCLYLAGKGYNVLAAVRKGAKVESLKSGNVKVVYSDYKDDLNVYIDESDIIIHAAALLSGSFESRRDDFYRANVLFTEDLLQKAAENRKLEKFIFISSVGIYGVTGKNCAAEDCPAGKNLSDYEWSKLETEKKCLEFGQKGMPVVILRLSQLYGPGMKYGWPKVFGEIKENKFYLIGRGQGTIQPLYIDDAVSGIEAAVVSRLQTGEIFNLAGKEIITLGQFFSEAAELMGVRKIGRLPYRLVYALAWFLKLIPAWLKTEKLNLLTPHNISFFSEKRCYNITKAKVKLNFNPLIDIKEGLKRTVKWYQASYSKNEK